LPTPLALAGWNWKLITSLTAFACLWFNYATNPKKFGIGKMFAFIF
jgi:hypothetical protein